MNGMSESAIVFHITEKLDSTLCSFWSNSMPVRDANTFVKWRRENHNIGVNRGASGIDGIIATANGFQVAQQRPCILTIGDLAAWHDFSSLIQFSIDAPPMLIVIINNGGGEYSRSYPSQNKANHLIGILQLQHDICGID